MDRGHSCWFTGLETSLMITNEEHYLVKSLIGKGQFSVVYKCSRLKKLFRDDVAVKVQKYPNITEINVLTRLGQGLGHEDKNIANIHEEFVYQGRLCLALDLMPTDLLTIVRDFTDESLCMDFTCLVIKELLVALSWMKEKGVIHSDLRMDNVLVDPNTMKWRVKLCDFGKSFLKDEAGEYTGKNLQPRSYRAPEIIIGAPVTEAIDMWALGCLSANLLLGINNQLFPSEDNQGQLQDMVSSLGHPPANILREGKRAGLYFTDKGKLKVSDVQRSSRADKEINFSMAKRLFRKVDMGYVDFLTGALNMNPTKRLDPAVALNMAFFRKSITA